MERVAFPSIMSSFPAAAGAIEAGYCGRSGQSPTEMVDSHHSENTCPPEARDLSYNWIALSFLLSFSGLSNSECFVGGKMMSSSSTACNNFHSQPFTRGTNYQRKRAISLQMAVSLFFSIEITISFFLAE